MSRNPALFVVRALIGLALFILMLCALGIYSMRVIRTRIYVENIGNTERYVCLQDRTGRNKTIVEPVKPGATVLIAADVDPESYSVAITSNPKDSVQTVIKIKPEMVKEKDGNKIYLVPID